MRTQSVGTLLAHCTQSVGTLLAHCTWNVLQSIGTLLARCTQSVGTLLAHCTWKRTTVCRGTASPLHAVCRKLRYAICNASAGTFSSAAYARAARRCSSALSSAAKSALSLFDDATPRANSAAFKSDTFIFAM